MVAEQARPTSQSVAVQVSPWRQARRRFFRHRGGVVGLIVTGLVVLAVIAAPLITPFPEDASGVSHTERRLQPPNSAFWFGTDELGRDVYSRVVFGGRVSLVIGALAVLSSAVFGTLLGLIAGYWPRLVDDVIMRLADVFLGVPSLVLAMLVALTFGGGAQMTIVAIAVTWWPRYARLVRGEVLRLKIQEYIEAARALGAGDIRILVRHILPGTLPLLAVQASLQMGQAILVAAALGFVGLGARPPSPEWGLSVAIGREYLPDAWWPSSFPGMLILITVVALNLVGDGLRVALDSRVEQQ